MARKRVLSYHEKGRCWRKFRRGRMFYLDPRGVAKDDEQAYQQAVANWQRLLGELEREEKTPTIVTAFETLDRAPAVADTTDIGGAEVTSLPQCVASFATDYSALPTALPRNGGPAGDTRLSAVLNRYLAEKIADVDAGQIGAKSYAETQAKLRDFQAFAKHFRKSDVNQLDSDLLAEYRRQQLALVAGKKISKVTARKRLQIVSRFVVWAYKSEILKVLPRVLVNGYAKIKLDPPSPEFYATEEIHQILRAAPPLLRACCLLSCNAGYYQTDCASLTWEMIDLKTGVVDRKREKTGQRSCHKLWPVTLEALKALSPNRKGLVFRTTDGQPIVIKKLVDGELRIYDTVTNEFRKLQRKLKTTGNGKGFSTFRNTSANMLAKHFPDTPWVTDEFLAHSTGGTRRNYVTTHFESLFSALDWLATQYNFSEDS